jgi:hypothetical protein
LEFFDPKRAIFQNGIFPHPIAKTRDTTPLHGEYLNAKIEKSISVDFYFEFLPAKIEEPISIFKLFPPRRETSVRIQFENVHQHHMNMTHDHGLSSAVALSRRRHST